MSTNDTKVGRPPLIGNRQAIRNAVGQGKFTYDELAEGAEVSKDTAQATVQRFLDEGLLEAVGTRVQTDEEGNPKRGRPSRLFRLVKGSPKA